MLPSFSNDDYVLIFDSSLCRPPRINQVVLVNHPRLGKIIKRIAEYNTDKGYLLVGDNRQKSTSSQSMGWIQRSDIYGKVIWHIKAPKV